jgi:hypothetical protein
MSIIITLWLTLGVIQLIHLVLILTDKKNKQ